MTTWRIFLGWPRSPNRPSLARLAPFLPLEAGTLTQAVGLWRGTVEDTVVIDLVGTEDELTALLQWWHAAYPDEESALIVKVGSSTHYVQELAMLV